MGGVGVATSEGVSSDDERGRIRAWAARQRDDARDGEQRAARIERLRQRAYASDGEAYGEAVIDYVLARSELRRPAQNELPRVRASAWIDAFRSADVSLSQLVDARVLGPSALATVALETDPAERTRVARDRRAPWTTLVEWAIPTEAFAFESLDRATEVLRILRAIGDNEVVRETLLASEAFAELERDSGTRDGFHDALFVAVVRRDRGATVECERALRRTAIERGDEWFTVDDGVAIRDRQPIIAAILAFAGEVESGLWWLFRAHSNESDRASSPRGFAAPPTECVQHVKRQCTPERWREFERVAFGELVESDAAPRRWLGFRDWASESFAAACDERATAAFERDLGVIEADALHDRAHRLRASRAAAERWNSRWSRDLPNEWQYWADPSRLTTLARVRCFALSDPECASIAAPIIDRLTTSRACVVDSSPETWSGLRSAVGLENPGPVAREREYAPGELHDVLLQCDVRTKRSIADRLERANAVRFDEIGCWIDRDFERRKRAFAALNVGEMMERALRWDDRIAPEVEWELLWWTLDRWARGGRPRQAEQHFQAVDRFTAHLHDQRASALDDPTDNRWAWDEPRLLAWLASTPTRASAEWIVEPGTTALTARFARSRHGRVMLRSLGDSLVELVLNEPDHPHTQARVAAALVLWPFAADDTVVALAQRSDEVARLVTKALPILQRTRGASFTNAFERVFGANKDLRSVTDSVLDLMLATNAYCAPWFDEWLEHIAPGGIDGNSWAEWRMRTIEQRVVAYPTRSTGYWWRNLRTTEEEQRLLAVIERVGAPPPWNPWLVDRETGVRHSRDDILAIAREEGENDWKVLAGLLTPAERASLASAIMDRWELELVR